MDEASVPETGMFTHINIKHPMAPMIGVRTDALGFLKGNHLRPSVPSLLPDGDGGGVSGEEGAVVGEECLLTQTF